MTDRDCFKVKGKTTDWLLSHVEHSGDECLFWPFGRTPDGYGNIGRQSNGQYRSFYAHRVMCDLVNGPAPSPRHHASHSCGKGHAGCVNPRHLSWKTPSDNQRDRARHGTKSNGPRGKLNFEKVAQIRALQGKMLQREIAERFGVGPAVIRNIHKGKVWTANRKRNIRLG